MKTGYEEAKLQAKKGCIAGLIALSMLAMPGLDLGTLKSAAAEEPEPAVVPQEGLVARWTFNDDCYGYDDSVGNPEFLDDSPMEGIGAVRFDGESALILGDAEELKPEKLTLSFWVRRTGSMTGEDWSILMDASTGTERYGDGWGLGKWGERETLFVLDGEDRIRWDYETDLDDFYSQNWMHFALTFDADREIFQIFKDGQEQASFEQLEYGFWRGSWDDASITAQQAPVSLGALSDGSEGVPLDFSDVRIYNRVLDGEEITHIITGVDFFEVEPEMLFETLQDGEVADVIRLKALNVLLEREVPEEEKILSVLLEILKDTGETDDIRLEVLPMLREFNQGEEVTGVLLDILGDVEDIDEVRAGALDVLLESDVEGEELVPVLLGVLENTDETDNIRLKVLKALAGE